MRRTAVTEIARQSTLALTDPSDLGGPSRFTYFNFKVFRGHAMVMRTRPLLSRSPVATTRANSIMVVRALGLLALLDLPSEKLPRLTGPGIL